MWNTTLKFSEYQNNEIKTGLKNKSDHVLRYMIDNTENSGVSVYVYFN